MTHPLKTVENDIKIIREALCFGVMPAWDVDDVKGAIKRLETTLRAIMGQDVEELKKRVAYLHDCYRNQRAPTYETVKFFDELASTGRICGVPDGYVMVPREPTEKMIEAARKQQNTDCKGYILADKNGRIKRDYKAMIEASEK